MFVWWVLVSNVVVCISQQIFINQHHHHQQQHRLHQLRVIINLAESTQPQICGQRVEWANQPICQWSSNQCDKSIFQCCVVCEIIIIKMKSCDYCSGQSDHCPSTPPTPSPQIILNQSQPFTNIITSQKTRTRTRTSLWLCSSWCKNRTIWLSKMAMLMIVLLHYICLTSFFINPIQARRSGLCQK